MKAYELALKKRCTFYDAVSVALALDLGLDLRTFDEDQEGIMRQDTDTDA